MQAQEGEGEGRVSSRHWSRLVLKVQHRFHVNSSDSSWSRSSEFVRV